jgi:hypothetical protein
MDEFPKLAEKRLHLISAAVAAQLPSEREQDMEKFSFSDSERVAVNNLLRSLANVSVGAPGATEKSSPESLGQLAAAAFPSAGQELDALVSLLKSAVSEGAEAMGTLAVRCGADCMITCAQPNAMDPTGCMPGGCTAVCEKNCQNVNYW